MLTFRKRYSAVARRREFTHETLEKRELLASDLVISEFLAVNQSNLKDNDGQFSDWIEITNVADRPVDLEGWYLTDNDNNLSKWQFPSAMVQQGESLVVYASNEDRRDPLTPLHTNFRLDSGGEFLALVEPDGTTIASAFAPEYPAQSADVSYGLSPDGLREGYFSTPTPGARNVEPEADPARLIIISEIMYHPASEDSAEEFIELHNASGQAISLDGWRLSGGVDFSFTEFSIPAGGYAVVASDVATFQSTYGNGISVTGPWTGKLSNQSDRITVRNETDLRVDEVTYADEGDWAVRHRIIDAGAPGWAWADDHDGAGKSLELINRSQRNDVGQNWAASVSDKGTPGARNSVDATSSGPFILDLEHSPAIPHSDESVVVSATIVSDDPPAAVQLTTIVNGQTSVLTMRDDGLNGDQFAGDSVYSAQVAPQNDLTVVEFFVTAIGGDDASRRWPADVRNGEGDSANALYQVIDAFELPDPTQEIVPSYYQIMTPADREAFTNIPRRSDAEQNATFISVDNEGIKVRYNTGVRIRGSGSRNANPPNNRINFSSDDRWNGVTAINLNVDTIQDQIAGSALFRAMGLPAGEAKAIRMFSNGVNLRSNRGGFYAQVEPLNGDFTENQFSEDSNGNLYKGRRPNESPPGGLGAGLAYNGPDPGPYVSYLKQTNASEADWSDVIELTNVLNNAPDETFLADVSAVVDLEQWLEFFALNSLISNTEGGLGTGDRQGDDYAMYRGIEDTRFQMVPHDLDSVLSRVNWSLTRWSNVPALHRLINHPQVRPIYFEVVRDVLDNFLTGERGMNAIEESLRPLGEAAINEAKNFIAQRADYVRSNLLQDANFVQTVHPTIDGLRIADRDRTHVHGVGHYAANSVLVNGVPATFSTRTNTFQLGSRSRITNQSVSSWHYLDNGSDQGTAWREPEFVPNADWKVGDAQLGFGDGDERTVIDFGPDPNNKHITTYFRHEFDVPEASRYYDLNLRITRDDGVIVYLNGNEIWRSNLPPNVDFRTLAEAEVTGSNERNQINVPVDPSHLVDGKNVLAVEVHLASPDSPDASMTAYMTGRYIGDDGPMLHPGINRVNVESYSGLNGTGDLLATTPLDFWYDDGDVVEVAGELVGETTWTAAAGPYLVTSDLTIPADSKLTIEPGTSVYFAQDAELIVNGILSAQGDANNRIRFTSDPSAAHVPNRPNERAELPAGPPRWDGIHFSGSRSDENIISFADIEYAQDNGGAIGVVNSSAMIDNVSISGTHLRMIFGTNASMTVQNSTFPDMFAPDENPAVLGLDNIAEHIKIIGRTPAGGVLLIQNNSFGTNKGHNDVIDADSNRVDAGPILQIIGNRFEGAGDELLDLGGDVFVYGNVFRNVFKDDTTSDRGYANAISTGDAGPNTTIVVAKNIFYDVDHAINLKNQAATIFESNTVVKVHPDFFDRFDNPNVGSVVNLFVDEPGGTPAKGAYVANNILWDVPRVFGNADLPTNLSVLEAHNNVIDADDLSVGSRPTDVFGLGDGNVDGDPRFRNIDSLDFALLDGSAALPLAGTEQLGWLAAPVSVTGEPATISNGLLTQLHVSGPGIFSYRYRVNGGPWSEEAAIGNGFDPAGIVRSANITLASLDDGEYFVEVQGRDFAGNWQPAIARTSTWTVQRGQPLIQINEVLADNRGAHVNLGSSPDVIELANHGTAPIDLRGYSISDRLDQPDKFTFDGDQPVGPGELLVLYADPPTDILPGLHLGFSLDSRGEGVYLFAPAVDGQPRELVDSIEFGNQLIDLSIGRVGPDNDWRLNEPTIGAHNRPAATGGSHNVHINEWLAIGDSQDDFVELYSSDTLPVDLGRHSLSDEMGGAPQKSLLDPLTFIAPGGFLSFEADNSDRPGHVDFNLSADQEVIGFLAPNGAVIDSVIYMDPVLGMSSGRSPDGSSTIETLLPTPGWANGTTTPGDFNLDETIDGTDVDLLCSAVRDAGDAPEFDLNGDGVVNVADMATLIVDILNTTFGDSNVDGIFNSTDLVQVFRAGEYEDGIDGNSTWAEGDWNCDGDFGTADLVIAFQRGGYSPLARPATIPQVKNDQAAIVDAAIDQLWEDDDRKKAFLA